MSKVRYQDWITPDSLTLIEGWARSGLIDEQIAHNIGITRQALHNWKKKYPEIKEALRKGKEVIDMEVENALLKRALGYDVEEVVTEATDGGKKHIKKTVKHIAGDTTAMIFWLKNRKPEMWRDKKEIDATVNTTSVSEIEQKVGEILDEFRLSEDDFK